VQFYLWHYLDTENILLLQKEVSHYIHSGMSEPLGGKVVHNVLDDFPYKRSFQSISICDYQDYILCMYIFFNVFLQW